MVRTKFACWVFIVLAALSYPQQRANAQKDGEAKPQRDEELRQELLKMVKEDQDARKEVLKDGSGDSPTFRKLRKVDQRNTARMKEIIAKHGWPGKGLVGDDGAHAAWLLVQHADEDREFQKRCLALLERAVKAREASAVDLAYLTDRVLVAEKKKQLYGTQFRSVDGKMEPHPIEDEKNVDRRRKEAGLPSMAEYRKMMEELYKPKKK
jgi:hypothetical protein